MASSKSKNVDHVGPSAKNVSPRDLLLPKGLKRIGLYHQAPGAHPPRILVPPRLEWVEIVTDGRGWVLIDNAWVEVTRGAFLWHVEGDESIGRSDWGNPYRCFFAWFDVERFRGTRRTGRLTWWHNQEEIVHFAQETISADLNLDFDRGALLHYVYGTLLFKSQMGRGTESTDEVPVKLRQALELIDKHSEGELSVSVLAKHVNWSVPHLHEIFRKYVGATPHYLILRREMRRAQEQLALTTAPIKEISSKCGFSNASAFCHSFKTHVGMTPLHFRRTRRLPRDLSRPVGLDGASEFSAI